MERKPLKVSIKKKPLKLKVKGGDKSETSVSAPELSLSAGEGIRIIFQNAKIHADKVIIKRVEK